MFLIDEAGHVLQLFHEHMPRFVELFKGGIELFDCSLSCG